WRGDSIELHGVEKVPGQGDFDNLHMSPQLNLELVRIEFNATIGQRIGNLTQLATFNPSAFKKSAVYVNEPEKTGTSRVWMAPFSSHDCLQTHWRWGSKESAPWTQGWNAEGPYKESGAPMVPLWQDAYMRIEAPNIYTYKAHSK